MDIDTLSAMIPGSFPFSPSSPSSTTSFETTDTVENGAASKTTDEELSIDEVTRHITIPRSCILKLGDALAQANDMLNKTTNSMTIPAKAMPEFTFPAPAENASVDAKCVEQIFEDVVSVLQALMARAGSSKDEPAEILFQSKEKTTRSCNRVLW
ncbi:hypothetical protein LTR84_008017 [Exophiala bonariae]|uniref:Uncharacterized protein n=1 Tax=Exophiala bonariae TaxID=1690606 RepID=A0AAV9NLQ3_9EURO|nr:hypothetical protein LTR84_008017 [Exophiala bonariae]